MLKQYFFIKPLLPIIVYLLFILEKSVILLNNKNCILKEDDIFYVR